MCGPHSKVCSKLLCFSTLLLVEINDRYEFSFIVRTVKVDQNRRVFPSV